MMLNPPHAYTPPCHFSLTYSTTNNRATGLPCWRTAAECLLLRLQVVGQCFANCKTTS